MRILFVGCVRSSEVLLKKLFELDTAEVVAVVTTKNNRINSDYVDLSYLCKEKKVDLFYTEDINDETTETYIKEKKPDVIYCFGWSRLIKQNILQIPSMGVIGYHPADLPNNKGRHPIIWALALGLEETASTFFKMDEGADSGDILSQKKVSIKDSDDASTLYGRLLDVACEQVRIFTLDLSQGKYVFMKQNQQGNSWRKRGILDGQIDWRMSCKAIYNLIRALTYPYVGAHFVYQGNNYKVWKSRYEITRNYQNIEPGKIIKVVNDTHFFVKAEDGLVEVFDCDPIQIREGMYL